ncbi:MAG: hypothetical protein ABEI31_05965 [Halodesulfurarchaeum sp.]
MTVFDADDPTARKALFADAIAAHRERDSQFVTVEADRATDPGPGPPPFVQYAAGAGRCNLDCLESERPALESVVSEFGGAAIVDRHEVSRDTLGATTEESSARGRGNASDNPEAGGGGPPQERAVNLRIRVPGDDRRIAEFIERCFVSGFGLDTGFRVWVTRI